MSTERCSFCGTVFRIDAGQPTCSACPLRGGCNFVRCPQCGYENAVAPAWLNRVRAWFRTDAARAAGYSPDGDYMEEEEAACR